MTDPAILHFRLLRSREQYPNQKSKRNSTTSPERKVHISHNLCRSTCRRQEDDSKKVQHSSKTCSRNFYCPRHFIKHTQKNRNRRYCNSYTSNCNSILDPITLQLPFIILANIPMGRDRSAQKHNTRSKKQHPLTEPGSELEVIPKCDSDGVDCCEESEPAEEVEVGVLDSFNAIVDWGGNIVGGVLDEGDCNDPQCHYDGCDNCFVNGWIQSGNEFLVYAIEYDIVNVHYT